MCSMEQRLPLNARLGERLLASLAAPGVPVRGYPHPTVSVRDSGSPFFPPPEAARWHSPGRTCPHAGAHHRGQAPSAVQGPPNICHLKLSRYFNDFESDSPPCSPIPRRCSWTEGALQWGPLLPSVGDPGAAVPPQGCSPAPASGEDVQSLSFL